jgi:hypothetical protein
MQFVVKYYAYIQQQKKLFNLLVNYRQKKVTVRTLELLNYFSFFLKYMVTR